jgi:hypothetical protein
MMKHSFEDAVELPFLQEYELESRQGFADEMELL